LSSNNLNEETLNPEIIDLVELGNKWNQAFPNSGTTLFNVNENLTREDIRKRLHEALEKAKILSKELKSKNTP